MKILKKFLKLQFILFILVLFIVIGFYIYAKVSPKILINSANNITLLDYQGDVFFTGSENQEWVSLEDISPYVISATIHTEDKYFYKHFGFDFLRIGKAMIHNILTKSTSQGASTITQQYAKNLFLDFDKTWKRKFDEDLSLAEASILVGIPKAPSNYSPLINYDDSKKRQLVVLNSLVRDGIITEKEKDLAYNEKLDFIGEEEINNLTSINYYQDALMDELESIQTIPKDYSKIGGLKIYTSFHYDLQKELEEIIKNTFPDESNLETSVVVMDPNTGGIMALVGGRDYNKSSYNRAIYSKRQVGSTMKPYLYYAALENGFTSSTAFISERTTFPLEDGKTYSPHNYNDIYGDKPISMATAIAYSDNIYAVKTHLFLGTDTLIQMAKRVGIKEELDEVPSLPLGTSEINIVSMASGYSSFANMGYKIDHYIIEKVEDGNGNILYENKQNKDLVLNPSLVYILNNMLTAPYDSSYIDYNYPTAISLSGKLTHTYALKSGTTSGDNWDIGYNKKVLCAVWVGHDDNQELVKSDYKYAQNIWYKTVEAYEEGKDDLWYEKPGNVVGILVEPISGHPATDQDKSVKLMYFLKGTEPKGDEPVFDEIEKN